MIAWFFLQAALGVIGPQALPDTGCAAFLWSRGATPELVAMAEPTRLRLRIDGKPVELARGSAEGAVALGLPAVSHYGAGTVTATLDITVEPRADIAQGAAVPQAVLTVEQPGRDTLVVPAAGLVGCRGDGQ